jgi:hypothetical protein
LLRLSTEIHPRVQVFYLLALIDLILGKYPTTNDLLIDRDSLLGVMTARRFMRALLSIGEILDLSLVRSLPLAKIAIFVIMAAIQSAKPSIKFYE